MTKLESDASLIAIRNNALIQIGFFGALRRSELAALLVEELAWERDGLVITLTRSKTDQEGKGTTKAIPYGSPDGICCPVKALKHWLEAANITSGPMFSRVTRWGVVGADPLYDGSISEILEAWPPAHTDAGLTFRTLSARAAGSTTEPCTGTSRKPAGSRPMPP